MEHFIGASPMPREGQMTYLKKLRSASPKNDPTKYDNNLAISFSRIIKP